MMREIYIHFFSFLLIPGAFLSATFTSSENEKSKLNTYRPTFITVFSTYILRVIYSLVYDELTYGL